MTREVGILWGGRWGFLGEGGGDSLRREVGILEEGGGATLWTETGGFTVEGGEAFL